MPRENDGCDGSEVGVEGMENDMCQGAKADLRMQPQPGIHQRHFTHQRYSLAGMIIPTNPKIMNSDVFSPATDHHLRAAC